MTAIFLKCYNVKTSKKERFFFMKIIDPIDLENALISSTAKPDIYPTYDPIKTYGIGTKIIHKKYVWYSTASVPINSTPSASSTLWAVVGTSNLYSFRDIYPDTVSEATGAFVLVINVVDIDCITIANASGKSIEFDVGGTIYSKDIDIKSTSAMAIWGLNVSEHGIGDFTKVLPALFTGVLKITITPRAGQVTTSIGFLNIGKQIDVGCTLYNTTNFNLSSGIQANGTVTGNVRDRTRSYREITLNVKVENSVDDGVASSVVLSILSRYRGIPITIIGDDVNKEKSMVFFGIYTNIRATKEFDFRYNITLRSLESESFTPPTLIEEDKAVVTETATTVTNAPQQMCLDAKRVGGVLEVAFTKTPVFDENLAFAILITSTTIKDEVIKVNGTSLPLHDSEQRPMVGYDYPVGTTILVRYRNAKAPLPARLTVCKPACCTYEFPHTSLVEVVLGGSGAVFSFAQKTSLRDLEPYVIPNHRMDLNLNTTEIQVKATPPTAFKGRSSTNVRLGSFVVGFYVNVPSDYVLVYVGGDKDPYSPSTEYSCHRVKLKAGYNSINAMSSYSTTRPFNPRRGTIKATTSIFVGMFKLPENKDSEMIKLIDPSTDSNASIDGGLVFHYVSINNKLIPWGKSTHGGWGSVWRHTFLN